METRVGGVTVHSVAHGSGPALVTLLGRYPHATSAVVDGAGHALLHERPEVVGPLLADWGARAR